MARAEAIDRRPDLIMRKDSIHFISDLMRKFSY
jgi:hypothetical protein